MTYNWCVVHYQLEAQEVIFNLTALKTSTCMQEIAAAFPDYSTTSQHAKLQWPCSSTLHFVIYINMAYHSHGCNRDFYFFLQLTQRLLL